METTVILISIALAIVNVILMSLAIYYLNDRNSIQSAYEEANKGWTTSITSHQDTINLARAILDNLGNRIDALEVQQSKLITSINKVVLKEAAKKKTGKSDIDTFIEKNNKIRDKRVDKAESAKLVKAKSKRYNDDLLVPSKELDHINKVCNEDKNDPTAPQSFISSSSSTPSSTNYSVNTLKS